MLEAFRQCAAEEAAADERAQRATFSRDAFAAAHTAAAGLVSDALNVGLTVEDEEGEIYHPALDEDTCAVTVSLAMPPHTAATAAAVVGPLQLAALARDASHRRGREPPAAAVEPEGLSQSDAAAFRAEAEAAAERALASWAADLTLAAKAGPGQPSPPDGLAASVVGRFCSHPAELEASVAAVLKAAEGWAPAALRLVPDAARLEQPRAELRGMVAALEVPRCRALRACIDADVAAVIARTVCSAAGRLKRRRGPQRDAEVPPAVAALYRSGEAMHQEWASLSAAAEAVATDGEAEAQRALFDALREQWRPAVLRGEAAATLWEQALRG